MSETYRLVAIYYIAFASSGVKSTTSLLAELWLLSKFSNGEVLLNIGDLFGFIASMILLVADTGDLSALPKLFWPDKFAIFWRREVCY